MAHQIANALQVDGTSGADRSRRWSRDPQLSPIASPPTAVVRVPVPRAAARRRQFWETTFDEAGTTKNESRKLQAKGLSQLASFVST
jgi:hypothetical protein